MAVSLPRIVHFVLILNILDDLFYGKINKHYFSHRQNHTDYVVYV